MTDLTSPIFNDEEAARAHFRELGAEMKQTTAAQAFGMGCLEVLSWPATIVFMVCKFALCGSLGLVGAILSRQSKERGIAFGRSLAYAPHALLTFIPNQISKRTMSVFDKKKAETIGRELGIVKTRDAELFKSKKAALLYIDSSPNGHGFLVKWCNINISPSEAVAESVGKTTQSLEAGVSFVQGMAAAPA